MGKKIDDEKREIVRAARASGLSFKKCAEAAGVSETSVRRILEEHCERKIEEEAAEKGGKERFVKSAWEVIDSSLDVIKTRLALAKEEIGPIYDMIADYANGKEISDKERNQLMFRLERAARELMIPSIKELGSLVGVMYDRQALAKGEATENVNINPEDMKLLESVNRLMNNEKEK